MSFFSHRQRKVLLILWALVLIVLYAALAAMHSTSYVLFAAPIVVALVQITSVIYGVGFVFFLPMWLWAGRRSDTRDYAVIFFSGAVILVILLNVNLGALS